MEIFEPVIDEIALSGLEGCTTKELWHHLSNRKSPKTFPLALNEQAKDYIWSLLLESSSEILNFYVLKNPRQFEGDDLFFTYRLVSDSGIRGSCWDYDTREDVTAAIFNDDTNRNLSQVITRYGKDQLVMVAIQEVRIKTLGSPSVDPMYSVNDVQYCVLEAVGRARDRGILRSHLTNKYLKIDPRSTFHHVAILQSIGTIIIKAYSKGYQLFLTRFSAYADQLNDEVTLIGKVCNMLLQAPDRCLPESEIAKDFKSAKHYRRTRNRIMNKGLVEIVESANGETKLKLIKPVKQAATANPLSGEGLDIDDANEQQENDGALPKHFVVAERLFDMQAYRILDSAGPAGMTVSEFSQSVQGVDVNTKRATLANLSKLGCVVSILIDDYKVKKYRYITNNQAGKSSDISKLKSEAKKSSHAFTLAIRSKKASVIDQTATTVPPMTTTLSTASASLETATASTSMASTSTGDATNSSVMDDDAEVEGILKNPSHGTEASVRVKSPATPTLNIADFHQRQVVKGIPLKKMERINFILECIETEKVILSKHLMYKKVLEFETRKGITTKIDRKTLSKLLQSLVDKGMVNVKTIQLAASTKSDHSIYYHSSATEARLAEAVKEARDLFPVKEIPVKQKQGKDKKTKATEENNDDVVITIPETLTDLKDDAYVLIPVASRFQRLQHLHLYLWILQYGLPDDAILSSVTFPWIPAVSKVDNIDDMIRWRMIVDNMPLSLLIIIVGVHQKRMPRKLYEFIQRPENRNLVLRQLPRRIQFYINAKRRDVVRIYELLLMLEDMKLAIIHQPTGQLIKISVKVELLHSCSVLDTSNIKARHSFFLEESRSKFNSITFQFDSVKDLQAYWFKLKSVCMMTKIFNPRGDNLPDDEYALSISSQKKVTKDYNKLGFGAGGVIPLMYSHMLYHWGTMTFFKSEQELQDSTADNKPILPEISYTDLPMVPPDDSPSERLFGYPFSGRGKRKLLALEGGSATISAAKRVKRAASQKLQKKKTNLSTKEKKTKRNNLVVWSKSEDGVLMRCHVALCILNAHILPIPTPVEMCEIIHDWIIPNRLKHAITTQKHMNTICSRDSTVCDQLKKCVDELLQTIEMGGGPPLNFKSLLHYLIDNYRGCVPSLGVAALSPTTSPTASLPTTLRLLKQSCEVCAPHQTGLLLPPVHTVTDIRKSMLVDLIIAVMGAGSECYSEYTAFHLFEEYLEQELEDAIALLRSALLVKHRKLGDGKTGKHFGPSATQYLMLHNSFYSRLESSFPCHLFEDIYAYSANLDLASTESAPKEEEWRPGGGEIATKLQTLAGSTFFCSSADSYMSTLASCDVELSSCYFVGKQSLSDVPQLDDEDDDCEDDEKENTGEERKITDCLPYHISIPLPDNRNFCDLTFRHGYSIGSLLACDSSNANPYPSEGLTEVQGMMDNSECVMDDMEYNAELDRDCVLDSAEPMVVHDKADDSMEHSVKYDMERDMEHGMEHTLDSAGPTVEHNTEHTQRSTTEHSQEQAEDVTSHTKCDPQLSIDQYLQLCVKHLNYSEYDVVFAKYLYDTIYHAGVMGVPQLHLEQLYQIGITMTTSEHLQQLKNFEMVMEVGVQVVTLVAVEHKRVWLLHMKKQHSPDRQFTKCRPWTSFHGQEFTGMCQKMQDAVLFYIMDYPGVTMYALEHHFTGIMQLNSLRDILEVLIASGCISCHRMIRQRSCDLFSSTQAIVAPSDLYDDIPSNIYFEPLIGCELVYSQSLQPSNDVAT